MNMIKVSFSIDIDSDKQVEAMNIFINSLKKEGGHSVVEAPLKNVKGKPEQPAPAETKQAQATTAAPAEATKAPLKVEGDSKKLEAIRKTLSEKIGANREVIKAKLAEFGTSSLTDLTVDKYEEMHEFLNDLE